MHCNFATPFGVFLFRRKATALRRRGRVARLPRYDRPILLALAFRPSGLITAPLCNGMPDSQAALHSRALGSLNPGRDFLEFRLDGGGWPLHGPCACIHVACRVALSTALSPLQIALGVSVCVGTISQLEGEGAILDAPPSPTPFLY